MDESSCLFRCLVQIRDIMVTDTNKRHTICFFSVRNDHGGMWLRGQIRSLWNKQTNSARSLILSICLGMVALVELRLLEFVGILGNRTS